ncbi:MAG: diacylglyceryl transferase [Chloroflexi bacterium CG23_combo_of_CG06-09_8_20_14_all_45_10]|nr:MAG: diacylglyceryl transferase [Chloroflexi bacterium CG23_combo_of_CG06-09_8_20_14_all_45_10]
MLTISINPVAFTIGSLTVMWYGIMVALAVMALLAMALRETRRVGISQDIIYNLFLWGIIGGFIVSRLVHVIDQWNYYTANPGAIVGFAGLSLYGAIIGALLAVWVYMRVRRIPFSSLAGVGDAIAVGAPLAQAIGRVGCTINGCCYGKLSPFQSFPGAVLYTPRDVIPSQYWGVPLYPTQIYFLLWNLIVFAIVWQLRDRLKPQGSLFFLYLCLYAAGDFGLRFFRVNEPFLLGLQQGQVISLAILVIAVPWLIIRMRRFQRSSQHSANSIQHQSDG